eukprot:Em0428g2a
MSAAKAEIHSLDYGSVDQLLPLLDDGLLAGQVAKKGSTRSALSCMATASSKQAHHHTSRHYYTIWRRPAGGSHQMERATHNAGQEICLRFYFGRCNKWAECYFTTGAGSQAMVESIPPRPGHALHQWPCDLQRTHTILQTASSYHSTTSELTPLYELLLFSSTSASNGLIL